MSGRRRRIGIRALWCVLVCGACQEPLRSPPVRPRASIDRAQLYVAPAGLTKLRLLVSPVLPKSSLERSHQKLVEFLSDQLEVPVELMVGDNYEDVLARTRAGAFDLAILSPYLYVRAVDGNPLPCLVQMIGDGSATAAGYIVVREDSSIRDLTDLPGKRMAFVDRFSTSGYLFPAKLLLDVGIDPHKHLASADFFGNHEAVLLAVLNGEAHAGATFQGALVALKKTQSVDPLSFRVIAKTERTRRDIVCARSDLPEVVRTQIQQQLLMLTVRGRMGREILNPLNVNGFQLSEDAAYDGIREVARQVEAWENQAP